MNRGRVFGITAWAVLVIAAFICGGLWNSRHGRPHGGRGVAVRKPQPPSQGDLPYIDGRITKVRASPDFRLIAVQYLSRDGAASVAIFDPTARKILFTMHDLRWEFGWSPDSKWIAAYREPLSDPSHKGLVVFGKDGTYRTCRVPGSPIALLWVGPTRLLLCVQTRERPGDSDLYECDPARSTLRKLQSHLGSCAGIFLVHKEPHIALLMRRTRGHESTSQIVVKSTSTGCQILRVPITDFNGICDWATFSISPSGKYFAMSVGMSGSVDTYIAKTVYAQVLTKRPELAGFCEYGTDQYEVLWNSADEEKSPYPPGHGVIANSSGFLSLVDPLTGSRNYQLSLDHTTSPDITYLAPWDRKKWSYLVVTQDQLIVAGIMDVDEKPLLGYNSAID